jgi:fructose-1,6-bisphosphatase
MGPSLLLALLKGVNLNDYPIDESDITKKYGTQQGHIVSQIRDKRRNNIDEVVSSIENKQPSLLKDIAQKELYDILYSTIENETEDEQKKQENESLNNLIGMVLADAIEGRTAEIQEGVQELRGKLRKKIIDALTPKSPQP